MSFSVRHSVERRGAEREILMPIKTALLAAVSLSLTLPVVAQSDSDADTTLETIIVEGIQKVRAGVTVVPEPFQELANTQIEL